MIILPLYYLSLKTGDLALEPQGSERQDKHFLVARSDGLGARLLAMLNAIVLAKHFDVTFRFVWGEKRNTMHAIAPANLTFDQLFLRDHYLDEYNPKDYYDLGSRAHTEDAIRRRLASAESGISVLHWPMTQIIHPLEWSDIGQRYADAFREIVFTESVREAMSAASAVELPANPVAVHLRAGDIVFGTFRFMKTYNGKVLSYPVAKRLVRDLLAEGRYPIIFGQDAVTCRLLAEKFKLQLGSELLKRRRSASNLEATLAEVTLMSRCDSILSGSSAFSILAGWAGNRIVREPREIWTNEEIVQTILEESDLIHERRLPDLQRAFSYFSAAHTGATLLSIGQRLELLRQAVTFDPCNGFYWLLSASLQLSEGRVDDAENDLRHAIVHGIERDRTLTDTTLFRMLSKKNSNGVPFLLEYVNCIRPIAGVERPGASFIVALSFFIQGKHEEAACLCKYSVSLGECASSLERLIVAATADST